MSKRYYSFEQCAGSIEYLIDLATPGRRRATPSRASLELMTEHARQIVAMLREPKERAAIVEALAQLHGGHA